MDILKEIIALACVAFLGSMFNLFVCTGVESSERFKQRTVYILFALMLVAELVAGHFVYQDQLAENKTRRHTAYAITTPDGTSCNGHYYSGKNDPITVICLDGRKFVAQSIQVKGTVLYNPDSISFARKCSRQPNPSQGN